MEYKQHTVSKIIDYIVLFFLISFSILYSIFYSNFAEINIQLSFLSFPIFIGEILLILCSLFLFYKLLHKDIEINKCFVFLFFFILLKAFIGYSVYGALAFRNAALFYYVFFAIIGYYFFQPFCLKFRFVYIILFGLFVSLFLIGEPFVQSFFYINYGFFSLFFLNCVVKKSKYSFIFIFIVILLLTIKIMPLLSRGIIVSFIISLMFLILILFFYFLDIKPKYKIFLCLIFFAVNLVNIILLANTESLKSLIKINHYVEEFQKVRKITKKNEEEFVFEKMNVEIYQKNKNDITTKIDKPVDLKNLETLILQDENIDKKDKIILRNKLESAIKAGIIKDINEIDTITDLKDIISHFLLLNRI